ncbi:hypothetical protein [Wolbachia endosymbiont (group A) of Epistrophe grossularia]|uniref:hypothetical protein n=1 Tax=Wolbachia endosymbiont (group A) of Epistrophe grossularia TaxID=2954008 RepID=UPI00223017D6|nr:hypothetical protein [Wolbachia endosymbiont (group A) of Epistrophe grossularia]
MVDNQVNLRSTRTSVYPTRVKDKKYYDRLQDSSDDEGQGEKSLVKATQQRQATYCNCD